MGAFFFEDLTTFFWSTFFFDYYWAFFPTLPFIEAPFLAGAIFFFVTTTFLGGTNAFLTCAFFTTAFLWGYFFDLLTKLLPVTFLQDIANSFILTLWSFAVLVDYLTTSLVTIDDLFLLIALVLGSRIFTSSLIVVLFVAGCFFFFWDLEEDY